MLLQCITMFQGFDATELRHASIDGSMQALIGTLLMAFTLLLLGLLAIHVGFHPPRRVERGSPADFGLVYREIIIRTHGGKRLFAWWLPVADSAATVIVLHGWGGNAELMLPMALPLHRAGLNVLLLDARNHGRSDSAFVSSLPRFAEDAADAIDWVKTEASDSASSGIVLLGHSVGAGAVLFEASRRQDISAVISVAAFAHPEWMMRRYLSRFRLPEMLVRWILRYIEWIIGHRYEDIAPLHTACRVRCPLLLVHGTADRRVPLTDALAIRDSCDSGSVELLTIKCAGHDSVEQIEEHGNTLVRFLTRVAIPMSQIGTGTPR